MNEEQFSMTDLMDLLEAVVGLPAAERTDDESATLTGIGLDSLAFLQLQTVLKDRHDVVIDESEDADSYSMGRLVALVNGAQEVAR